MKNRSVWTIAAVAFICCIASGVRARTVVGVSAHLARGATGEDVSLILELGVQSVRSDAFWSMVEVEAGVYEVPHEWDQLVDSLVDAGVDVMWILCYGNWNYDISMPDSDESRALFVKYVEHLVEHFKGRVVRYEVWNEWEMRVGNTERGDAESYFKLVREVYPAIKRIDKSVDVLVGAISADGMDDGYLERFVRLGGMKYGDGLSLHPYVHCNRFRREPRLWREWMDAVYADVCEWSGEEPSIYLTEMGWPTHSGPCGISYEMQADFLKSIMRQVETMDYIKGVWWFSLKDSGQDLSYVEHNYGLVRYAYEKKPAFDALKEYLIEETRIDL